MLLTFSIVDMDSNEYGDAVYFDIEYDGVKINDSPCHVSAEDFDGLVWNASAEVKHRKI